MPKYSGRGVKTIRGTVTVDANSRPVESLIFNYESPDRTKGWIVEDAWAWIVDFQVAENGGALTADVSVNVYGNLATDSGSTSSATSPPTANATCDPDESRQIGWLQKQWAGKNTNDFYMPQSTGITDCAFLLDLERIVTNDLYINLGYQQSGGGDVLKTRLGYMIVLREVDLSPSQSLLQQLKGIGQNIDN